MRKLTGAVCTALVLALGVGSTATAAKKKPCSGHPVKVTHEVKKKKQVTRASCIKQHKRNKMAWPPKPKAWEIKRRIGWHWDKAERVAVCETGANWQHYPHGSYIGGLGMFRSTYGIGQTVTGYRWPSEGATKQEQIAVGYIVAKRFGWSAWGCGSA